MLLLYIFSFKNFLWFKSFFWFIPIYCFNPTQTGGSYSWERFSGFSRPLSQIVDLDSQYQILWHFSYQIFTRRTHCALHLQKIVPIWPKSATLILCAESIWKCYYSNLRRINLVTVWSIKCRDFFPETSKIIFFLAQMIYNRFKSFKRVPYHWISFRTTPQYFMKNCTSLDIFLGKCPATVPLSSWTWDCVLVVATGWWLFVRNCFQRHPKLGWPSDLEEVKSLNIIFGFKYRYYKKRNFFA